jgi:RNA polymerase sigma-70 factor, ECF subfamily
MTAVNASSQELLAARLPDHFDRMYRTAYVLSGTRHDAEDLVQETFARVLARPRHIRREDERSYLLRALRNTWIDLERARSARPSTSGGAALESVSASTGDPAGLPLDVRVAYDTMSELSPKLRRAIAAVDVLGLPYREAARALGIRQGTLQSRLARARAGVAAALQPAVPRSADVHS